jgi:holliday junction DNA helicase RuvA
MICFLRGRLVKKLPARAEVDVNGVGYEVIIPLSTYDSLPSAGDTVSLVTYDHVREDAHILYGFTSDEEKELFSLIIQVNRIGPKIALSILSEMTAREFSNAVVTEDVSTLAGISGVGKKTAERIVMELKEKIPKMAFSAHMEERVGDEAAQSVDRKKLQDAINALELLGYKRPAAYKACVEILNKNDCPVEELVRSALRSISS